MATMPLARIHQPNDIRLDHVEQPSAGANDIVLQVNRCGICGSDLSYAKLGGIPGAARPFAIGHEFAGLVVDAGKNVKHLQTGDRVVINPEGGHNAIGSGGHKGAFAPFILFENVTDDPDAIIRLPASIDDDLGALVEPFSVGMNGVDRSGLKPGERVVVFGAGPVGLASALVARYRGAAQVVITDLSDKRLAIAAELGLTPFNAASGNIEDFLKQTHGSVQLDPLLGEQSNTDIFIEATGVGDVFKQILGMARKNARVVVIGVHFTPVELDMISLLTRQLSIIASIAYTNKVFANVIAMFETGAVDARKLITHHYPLSRFNEAFEQATRQDQAVKVMIDCQQ